MSDRCVKADIVVGIQWGDEGKGRVVDYYASNYDIVARFGGGDNAGHSIVVGDQHLALRIVPSGVMHSQVELFIGGGTVVSLSGFLGEIDSLRRLGIDVSRIKISDRAHIVFPYHAAADRANELARGAAALGTTGRGIGPAYSDRVARAGITFGDLQNKESLADKIRINLNARSATMTGLRDLLSEEDTIAQTLEAAEAVLPHVVDGVAYIHDALENGRRLLIEGAQGTLLDVGYGTYPFVTSSSTLAGGACVGLAIGPTTIGRVIGVVKAYCTRVGSGPFPSELDDEFGERLRKNGAEFGTVTGRPRRCGWFDAVAAKYAVRVNGLTAAVLTKLDVLTGFERIGVVTGYERAGKAVGFEGAAHPGLQTTIEYFEGWTEDISGVRRIRDLPEAAVRYVNALQSYLDVPFEQVSLGPERSQLAV
ncbi:MAG: adenylosuccinate synthase [Candidatus Eremiobacteraeota bacterium]|nr:adenylosuccinate synthase [Candidatus Eremiobacteraeota bacterium]